MANDDDEAAIVRKYWEETARLQQDKAKRELGTIISPRDGKLDYVALKQDISLAGTWYRVRNRLSGRKNLGKKFEKVAKAAQRLNLSIDDDVRPHLPRRLPNQLARIEALENYEPERDRHPAIEEALGMNAWSPVEWLVGQTLVAIYEKHWGEKAGYSIRRDKGDGLVVGRYIDFAEAVLNFLQIFPQGKPYSRASIARAVTKCRSGKPRRKSTGKQS